MATGEGRGPLLVVRDLGFEAREAIPKRVGGEEGKRKARALERDRE